MYIFCLVCARFGSLIACETFHADVHAGNLLVLNDGRVGFIDFGNKSPFLPLELVFKDIHALEGMWCVGSRHCNS